MIGPPQQKSGRAFFRDSVPLPSRKTRSAAEALGEKCHSCKPLPIRFRRDGFDYRQIAREGNAAIYEQRWNDCRNPSVSYEVIRVRRREGFQIGNRFIPPAEAYPRSEQWGQLGWTFCDKEGAFGKLSEQAVAQ